MQRKTITAAGEPGRSANGKNPLKNVLFGEEHLDTVNSPDLVSDFVNLIKLSLLFWIALVTGILWPLAFDRAHLLPAFLNTCACDRWLC
jgi:hypothetical protein